MKKNVIVLISLIIILLVVNYNFLDSLLINFFDKGESVIVERVIDGDTVVAGNISVRLLGINSPEKGEQYYEESKNFLENLVLNRSVELEFGKEKKDLYNRTLAYIFVEGKNVNLELVRNGFANFYFPSGKDNYYNDFKEAWGECVDNLCEGSDNKCIELEKFDYENEIVVFYNNCGFDIKLTGWEIKDEGRKKFVFPEFVLEKGKSVKVIVSKKGINNQDELFWKRNSYVWTNSGDTLFLRDEEGKLVLWENY